MLIEGPWQQVGGEQAVPALNALSGKCQAETVIFSKKQVFLNPVSEHISRGFRSKVPETQGILHFTVRSLVAFGQ